MSEPRYESKCTTSGAYYDASTGCFARRARATLFLFRNECVAVRRLVAKNASPKFAVVKLTRGTGR